MAANLACILVSSAAYAGLQRQTFIFPSLTTNGGVHREVVFEAALGIMKTLDNPIITCHMAFFVLLLLDKLTS